MNKFSLLAFIIFVASFPLFGNQITLHGVSVEYELPAQDFIQVENNNPNNPRQTLIIKFPSKYSDKYQSKVTPNLAIISEQVPTKVTTLDYFLFQLENFKKFGINTTQTKDDILECNLPESMTFFSEYNKAGVIHNIFHVSSVYKGVAFSIIFDATDDIYVFYHDSLKKILKSLYVVKS